MTKRRLGRTQIESLLLIAGIAVAGVSGFGTVGAKVRQTVVWEVNSSSPEHLPALSSTTHAGILGNLARGAALMGDEVGATLRYTEFSPADLRALTNLEPVEADALVTALRRVLDEPDIDDAEFGRLLIGSEEAPEQVGRVLKAFAQDAAMSLGERRLREAVTAFDTNADEAQRVAFDVVLQSLAGSVDDFARAELLDGVWRDTFAGELGVRPFFDRARTINRLRDATRADAITDAELQQLFVRGGLRSSDVIEDGPNRGLRFFDIAGLQPLDDGFREAILDGLRRIERGDSEAVLLQSLGGERSSEARVALATLRSIRDRTPSAGNAPGGTALVNALSEAFSADGAQRVRALESLSEARARLGTDVDGPQVYDQIETIVRSIDQTVADGQFDTTSSAANLRLYRQISEVFGLAIPDRATGTMQTSFRRYSARGVDIDELVSQGASQNTSGNFFNTLTAALEQDSALDADAIAYLRQALEGTTREATSQILGDGSAEPRAALQVQLLAQILPPVLRGQPELATRVIDDFDFVADGLEEGAQVANEAIPALREAAFIMSQRFETLRSPLEARLTAQPLDEINDLFSRVLRELAEEDAVPDPRVPEPVRALLRTYSEADEALVTRFGSEPSILSPGFEPQDIRLLYEAAFLSAVSGDLPATRGFGADIRSRFTISDLPEELPTLFAEEGVLEATYRLAERIAREKDPDVTPAYLEQVEDVSAQATELLRGRFSGPNAISVDPYVALHDAVGLGSARNFWNQTRLEDIGFTSEAATYLERVLRPKIDEFVAQVPPGSDSVLNADAVQAKIAAEFVAQILREGDLSENTRAFNRTINEARATSDAGTDTSLRAIIKALRDAGNEAALRFERSDEPPTLLSVGNATRTGRRVAESRINELVAQARNMSLRQLLTEFPDLPRELVTTVAATLRRGGTDTVELRPGFGPEDLVDAVETAAVIAVTGGRPVVDGVQVDGLAQLRTVFDELLPKPQRDEVLGAFEDLADRFERARNQSMAADGRQERPVRERISSILSSLGQGE